MRDSRDVWQEAFDEEMDRSDDSLLASKVADDAVADYLAAGADAAYDRWRDEQVGLWFDKQMEA